MKRLLLIAVLLILYSVLLRLPILKTKIDGNDFYYKDVLGFVYVRHSSCGWIGSCRHWDSPILGVHSFTFKPLKYNGSGCLDAYAKTADAVYYFGNKQPIKNTAAFELINDMYAKDSESIYKLCDLELMNSTDANQFQLIGPICAKSSTRVYCFQKEVVNADAGSFEHIWRGYYRDKYHVYYLGKTLDVIHPSTFELLSWGYIKDESALYFFDENKLLLSKLVNHDKDSFEVLTNYYAKDRFNVYKSGVVVSGADPTIFVIPRI